MKVNFIILQLFFTIGIAKAQDLLTVKDAVEIALANNYDIKLSRNDLEIAQENITYGNAGFLPNLTGNLTQNNNLQNINQTQSSGEVKSLKNAKNNSLNYGVSLGWTIFDGMGMFTRYDILKENQKKGDISLKRTILLRVSDVITNYYTIVEQKKFLEAIDENILITKERVRTAENRFTIGKASRLEVLNAQVNLNEDESNRLRQINSIKNLKIALNSLLVRDLMTEFDVEDEVIFDSDLIYEDLVNKAKNQNPDLQLIAINRTLAELELKRIKADRYPTVRLNAGYNFSESESSLGFTTNSNARGLNYGVTVALNIFDGFNQRRNEQIAKIQIQNADLQINQQDLVITTAMATAFQTYETNLALAKIEESNEQIAKRNLEITLDKFKIGTISAIEFRDAQENFINASARLNSAKLQTKLSEIQLKEIVGNIDFN
ncbi:TolC family protein [Faecalibacter rhinopitheci]|uniref:TolC family protein n=1 Tax=Faecalibacter rhinopitheci TaxID=2779678 RepID=A0A8J7FWM6_9FLAO|nr:TolC family protein [Faecalibacter rhinopitheci]MBF0596913.1 TolC family protein [Faecalibacter rhinopitheci]